MGRRGIVIGVVVVAALAVLGLVVAHSIGGGSSGPDLAGAPSSGASALATPQGASRASAAPGPVSAEATWRTVLAGLSTARSRVFETADASKLAAADALGSPAYQADQALLNQLVGRQAHSSPLRDDIVDLTIRQSSANRAVLRVTDKLASYSYLSSTGAVLATAPATGPQRRDLTLVRVGGAWRLYEAVAVSS